MAELPTLSPGLSGLVRRVVDEEVTAQRLGSGSVLVLGTPELVRLMEAAAVVALAEALPAGWTSVGVAINLQHLAPTPPGLEVTARATLTEVQGRRLKFELTASDPTEEIGRGIHERALVEQEGFAAKANRKLGR